MRDKKNILIYSAVVILVLLFQGCVFFRENKSDKREIIVGYAKNMLNKEYRPGEEEPASGFDCSGLSQFVYSEAGVSIPRTSRAQYFGSRRLTINEIEPADLVFFSTNGAGPSHVGIFIGDGKFIHSPAAGKKVQVSSMDNSYWQKNFFRAGTYLK